MANESRLLLEELSDKLDASMTAIRTVEDLRQTLFASIVRTLDAGIETRQLLDRLVDIVSDQSGIIVRQEARIEALEAKITALAPIPAVPTSPSPPVVISSTFTPDIKISIGERTLTPTGAGEPWFFTDERRWTWDLDDEVRVVLDSLPRADSRPQHRVTLQYCWGNSAGRAIRTYPVIVNVDGEIDESPVRVHPGCRHAITYERRRFDELGVTPAQVAAWKQSGYLPNFSPNIQIPTCAQIEKDWKWATWLKDNPTSDTWSEDFGLCTKSWTGGVPLANEGSLLSPWDVALLYASDKDTKDYLWSLCSETAESSGNYPVHFWDRSTGAPYLYSAPEFLALSTLNADNLPVTKSASPSIFHPRADIAHDMALVNTMALITRERFYVEELESWVLLGPACRTRKERETGVYWSGQVRASAWWLRNLFHLSLVRPDSVRIRTQLDNALSFMARTFADRNSVDWMPSGLCALVPKKKDSPWMEHSADTVTQTQTGNLYFLMTVLGEIAYAHPGKVAAVSMLNHLAHVLLGVWRHSPSSYLCPWLQHAVPERAALWPDIMQTTFARLPETALTSFPPLITADIFGWWRAALLTAHDHNIDLPSSTPPLQWADLQIRDKKVRTMSLPWQLKSRKE